MQELIYQSFGDGAEENQLETVFSIAEMEKRMLALPDTDPERVARAVKLASSVAVFGRRSGADAAVQQEGSRVTVDLYFRFGTFGAVSVLARAMMLSGCEEITITDGRDYGCDVTAQMVFDAAIAHSHLTTAENYSNISE